MDASQYLSPWLSVEEIPVEGLSARVARVSTPTVSAPNQGGKQTPRLCLHGDNGLKPILVNSTSLKSLIRAWGRETDGWTGKPFRVLAPEVERFGRLARELRVFPADAPASGVSP